MPLKFPEPKPGEGAPARMPDSKPGATAGRDAEFRRLLRLQTIAQAVVAAGVVLTLCYFAKLPLVVLAVSILLAFILAPLADVLQHLRMSRALASLLAVVLFLAAMAAVVYVSYNRAQAFALELPHYRGEIRKILGRIERQAEPIRQTARELLPQNGETNVVSAQAAGPWDWMTRSLGSVTEIVFAASFIPFLAYFMLSWREHVRSASLMLFPLEDRHKAYSTLGLITSMIRHFIVGNVLIGLLISGVSVAVFGVLGLPYFYFLGIISGFLSLVPYLGVLLALVPPLLAGLGRFPSSSYYLIVIATVLGAHLAALNVLYPKFLGGRVQLNPLAVTLALLFWGWLWGPMGLILAIPITAALKIVLDHVEPLRAYGMWLGG